MSDKLKLSEIFEIIKPKTTIYNEFKENINGINFISSGEKNNGIVGKVEKREGYKIYNSGAITVPLKGTVLHAFLQTEDFYIAHQIAILYPKEKYSNLTNLEKIYYCYCIRENKFRFNYNRQADRTFGDLLLPNPQDIPNWVKQPSFISNKKDLLKNIKNSNSKIYPNETKIINVRLDSLFDVVYGTNLEFNKLEESKDGINFVSRTNNNNGISGKVKKLSNIETIKPPVLTIAAGGSVGETFLQDEEFYSGRDLYILYPKIKMTNFELLTYCYFIKMNSYRFNYNRQANKTLPSLKIPNLSSISSKTLEIFNIELDKSIMNLSKEI